jgi:hypothetical protein
MKEDPRWCGQRWDGEKMCYPRVEETNNDGVENV